VKMGGVASVYSSSKISVVAGERSCLCLALRANLDILPEVGVGWPEGDGEELNCRGTRSSLGMTFDLVGSVRL
jgi:hypothetical protein